MKLLVLALAAFASCAATAEARETARPSPAPQKSPDLPPRLFSSSFLEELFPSIQEQTGENAFLVSDYLCEFVMNEPEVFFRVVAKHRKEFEWWLDRLPEFSFTDYGGCLINQECLRTGMIANLRRFESADANTRTLRNQLLDRLAGITVRHVN